VLPFRNHWHEKRAVGISDDVHGTRPPGPLCSPTCLWLHLPSSPSRIAGARVWGSAARCPGAIRPPWGSRPAQIGPSAGWADPSLRGGRGDRPRGPDHGRKGHRS
jgi:hypothetical protein